MQQRRRGDTTLDEERSGSGPAWWIVPVRKRQHCLRYHRRTVTASGGWLFQGTKRKRSIAYVSHSIG